MNSQEALKETGKAFNEDDIEGFKGLEKYGRYAALSEGILYWFTLDGEREKPVRLDYVKADNWQPYHEVKEIRPEKAGELWKDKDGNFWHTSKTWMGGIALVGGNDKKREHEETLSAKQLSHNKNGWTREFPEVEDDSVERIEIEEVKIEPYFDDIIIKTSSLDKGTVFNKCKAKVTIEIPKDRL